MPYSAPSSRTTVGRNATERPVNRFELGHLVHAPRAFPPAIDLLEGDHVGLDGRENVSDAGRVDHPVHTLAMPDVVRG